MNSDAISSLCDLTRELNNQVGRVNNFLLNEDERTARHILGEAATLAQWIATRLTDISVRADYPSKTK